MLTYTTENGQRANIRLPDGSQVILNVASRLDVPANFAMGDRILYLRGEGMFSAGHEGGNPLTVVAGSVKARVLGTNFLVRHYALDTTTTVAVRDGKVAVGPVVLTAARQADVGRRGDVRVHAVDGTAFSFTTGVLTFNSVPLARAIPDLNRWFDADVRLGDPSLAERRVAAEFAASSLSDLAEVLEMTFDVRVVRQGRVLTLFPRE